MKNPVSVLSEIVDLIAPYTTNNLIIPKGALYHTDPTYTGDLYYGSLWGDPPQQYIYSNNLFYLTDALTSNFTRFEVDTLLPYMEANHLITIGDSADIVLVTDINEDTNILTTTAGKYSHVAGEPIRILGKQCVVQSDYNSGIPNIIDIASDIPILKGANLIVINSADYSTYITYEITNINSVFTSGDIYYYELTLDTALLLHLTYGDFIYIQSHPFYISKTLPMPLHYITNRELGPFFLDYMKAEMVDVTVDVKYQYNLYDTNNNILLSGALVQNTPVLYADIPASSFMLGDIIKGTVSYTTTGAFVGKYNEDGEFQMFLPFVTGIIPPTGIEWEADLFSPVNSSFFIQWKNGKHKVEAITANANKTITIIPYYDMEVSGILIGAKGEVGSYFTITDWKVNKKAYKLDFSILAKVNNQEHWLGSDILFKPLFPVIADIQFAFDKTNYDNGTIFI